MRRMMTRLGWGTKAHSPSALHSVSSFFSCDRLAKQRNVRIFFMHNKSQCCCAVTTGTLLIICKSHVFHYKQATSGPMAMRLCADVHGNNWNIQPVLMILWGDIFVLWRTCFNFWWIPARVLVFFGDYPPVIGPLPFLEGPPGEQFQFSM